MLYFCNGLNERLKGDMSLQGVLLLALLCVISEVVAQSVAPGDEDDFCVTLRASGNAPIPNYAPNMAILMDSNNYQNLLPNRTGAVWQQVDNDVNNDPRITTNVSRSRYFNCHRRSHMHKLCTLVRQLLY